MSLNPIQSIHFSFFFISIQLFSCSSPTKFSQLYILVPIPHSKQPTQRLNPQGFGSLPNLTFFDLSNNNFSGPIPSDLGNATKLQYLNISQNPLHTLLPSNIWGAVNLQIFSAISSHLTGKISDFIGCKSIYKIELQRNNFSGSIPWDIGHCEKLLSLSLGRNSLTGIISWEISALPSITDLDLSYNFLSGTIPSNFANCRTLETFNVSFNLLTGPIPSSGTIFPNLHPTSFSGVFRRLQLNSSPHKDLVFTFFIGLNN